MNSPADIQPKADIVFLNGIVYTVDRERNQAEALAVKDDKFIFVGSNPGVSQYVDSKTEVIDLNGKMVLPGFIDSHAHASATINEDDGVRLSHLKTLEDYVSAVKDFALKHPDFSVIYGHGWNNEIFPPEGPLKKSIDAVVSDRPVSLMSIDTHSIWVNSKALEMAGITSDTPSPAGGIIEINPATGEPGGTVRETARDLIQNPEKYSRQNRP